MPAVIPFIPLIASVAGPLLGKALGGGGEKKEKAPAGAAAAPAAARSLFQPAQVAQAQQKYKDTGTAKWNQIMANMGAGGGTGGPNFTEAIGSQAEMLGKQLGGLTTESGYGDNPMANMDAILKNVEGGIGAKYPVY